MTQKIAIAVIHGIGNPEPGFAGDMIVKLKSAFAAQLAGVSGAAHQLVIQPVYWGPVLQKAEDVLWSRLDSGGPMDFTKLRRFMVNFAADAIAYQPQPQEKVVYERVHAVVAAAFKELARQAGPAAPLCVIAHSLGTVIASNYIYDLEVDARKKLVPKKVRRVMDKTPLEKGQTLASLYTLGSPIALWSLRYDDYGAPIRVPSAPFAKKNPKAPGEWINFYDQDDVIGYPLKTVNAAYKKAVKEDRAVNVGGLLSSWNPLSHLDYWTDNSVIVPIAQSLASLWRALNA
jgi:hypothetical protein